MKVYAVSDIHTDYPENLDWVKSLTKEEFGDDALIVAGDVSDDETTFIETFKHLAATFRHVFFVTGNHELYLRRGTRAGEERERGGKEEEEEGEEEAPAASGSRPGDGGGDVGGDVGGGSGPLSSLPRPLRKFRDSVEKLAAINADLAALGVRTTPTLLDGAEVVSPSCGQGVGGVGDSDGNGDGDKQKKEREKKKKKTSTPVWIVPILSWYHAAFDTEPSIPQFNTDPRKIYTDFKACRWPPDLDPLTLDDGGEALATFFDSLNDPQLASLTSSLKESDRSAGGGGGSSSSSRRPVVIAFSHFLPFLELLPEKRFVTAPNLAKVAGSTLLGARVASLRPDVLVFGHTHIPFDGPLPASAAALGAGGAENGAEGEEKIPAAAASSASSAALPTRFVQAPLRYPAERRRSREGRGDGGSPNTSRTYELQLIWDCGGGGGGGSGSERGSNGDGEEEDEEEGSRKVIIERGKPGPTREAFWTRYYEENARDPDNLELAPWVRPRVERYKHL